MVDNKTLDAEKQALRAWAVSVVDYFIGDYSLKTIVLGLFFGSSGVYQVIQMLPQDWQTPEGYALLGMGFFGPLAAWLFIVSGYRWCVRQNNRPYVHLEGFGSFTEAHVRLTLFGDDASVSVTCRMTKSSSDVPLTHTPFSPDWFYEGDQTEIHIDQAKGRAAKLSHERGATIVLAKRDSDTRSWYRQPARIDQPDHGHPTAYAPVPVRGSNNVATTASYWLKFTSKPPLIGQREFLVDIRYDPPQGFTVTISKAISDGATR